MSTIRFKVFCLVLFFTLFISTSTLAASTEYKTFFREYNIEINKEWTIKFNKPLAQEPLNMGQIKEIKVIKNSDGQTVPNPAPEIQPDGASIKLKPPAGGYEHNTAYTLIVEGVKSQQGKVLAQPAKKEFVTATSPQSTLSPENTSVTTDSGITVSLGDYVLEEETELVVTPQQTEENVETGYKIEPYDINLGNMTELDDFITIRIPYDDSYCEAGQDASRCVGAKYYNETTGRWEDVLYEVDAAKKELLIYTDHLSRYGVFHVKNEGLRYAYISDVYADLLKVDTETATNALAEYVAKGGADGEIAVGLAASLVSDVFDLSGSLSSGLDIVTNPITIASLGNPVFDTALADKAYKKLGNLGKAVAVVKIGSTMLKSDASKEDILNLYKDVATFALGFSESAALGLAMSGIWVFDYTISTMFEQGMEIKMENIGMVYKHFNDVFRSGPYQARTLKDWRQVLIKIVEDNPNDEAAVKAAIEAEVDRYARVFWDIGADTQAEVASELGIIRMSYPTSAEIEALVADYKANLYDRLYPVSTSVRNYMQQKAYAEYVKSLNDMRAFYNQYIDFTIVEDVAKGAQPKYAGYVVRFEPLSDAAVKKNWTGTLNKDGAISTRFTMLGFIQAGCPNTIALYAPGDKPDEDEPKLRIGFTLKAPQTEVRLGGSDGNLIFVNGSESKIVDWAMATALKRIGSIELKPDGSFLASVAFADDGRQAVNRSNNIQVNNFELSGTFDDFLGTGTATVSFNSFYFRKDISPLQPANPDDVKEYVTTYEYTDAVTGDLNLRKEDHAVIMSGKLGHERAGFSKLQFHEINLGKEYWGDNPTITDKSGKYFTNVSYNFTLNN